MDIKVKFNIGSTTFYISDENSRVRICVGIIKKVHVVASAATRDIVYVFESGDSINEINVYPSIEEVQEANAEWGFRAVGTYGSSNNPLVKYTSSVKGVSMSPKGWESSTFDWKK